MKKILIAGPYVGEFGWELMAFQGYVRALSTHYDHVFVIGIKGKQSLYEDFAEFHGVDLPEDCGYANGTFRTGMEKIRINTFRKWCNLQISAVSNKIIKKYGRTHIETYHPDEKGLFPWIPTYRPYQIFIRYSGKRIGYDCVKKPRVVLVVRKRRLANERNATSMWWEEVASELDKRGIVSEQFCGNLKDGPDQLATADLATGPSTGGLHLANLCGCPHYVWGPGIEEPNSAGPWVISNKERYLFTWNPLGTPAVYDNIGWLPSVNRVIEGILRTLDRFETSSPDGKSLWRWKRRVWLPNRIRMISADLSLEIKKNFSSFIGNRLYTMTYPRFD